MAFRRLNGCHVITVYILIETEAGKAATWQCQPKLAPRWRG